MAAVKKMVSSAQALLKKLKAPWQITGPTAGPEYKEPIPDITLYRTFSPATAPKPVSVPRSEPEHVYDIKYFARSTRRTVSQHVVREIDPSKDSEFDDRLPPSPPIFVLAPRVKCSDIQGEGYQK